MSFHSKQKLDSKTTLNSGNNLLNSEVAKFLTEVQEESNEIKCTPQKSNRTSQNNNNNFQNNKYTNDFNMELKKNTTKNIHIEDQENDEINLDGFDLEEIFKTQIRRTSPRELVKKIKEKPALFTTIGFTQEVTLNEEDLAKIMENCMTDKKIPLEISKNNIKNSQSSNFSETLKNLQNSNNLHNLSIENFNININPSKSLKIKKISPRDVIFSKRNETQNISLNSTNATTGDFFSEIRNNFNHFISFFEHKFQEIDHLKEEVEKLKNNRNSLDSNFSNSFNSAKINSNNDKEKTKVRESTYYQISHPSAKINNQESAFLKSNEFENHNKVLATTLTFEDEIANYEEKIDMKEVVDDEFDFFLKDVKKNAKNNNNNANTFGPVCGFIAANKSTINNNNIGNYNKILNLQDDLLFDDKPIDIKKVDDDEFDSFLNQVKAKAKNNKKATTLNNNFTKNVPKNNIESDENAIDIKSIKDDEFDKMLNFAKKNKGRNNNSNFANLFSTAAAVSIPATNNEELIESDFMANNKKANIKINSTYIKFQKEFEEEVDGFVVNETDEDLFNDKNKDKPKDKPTNNNIKNIKLTENTSDTMLKNVQNNFNKPNTNMNKAVLNISMPLVESKKRSFEEINKNSSASKIKENAAEVKKYVKSNQGFKILKDDAISNRAGTTRAPVKGAVKVPNIGKTADTPLPIAIIKAPELNLFLFSQCDKYIYNLDKPAIDINNFQKAFFHFSGIKVSKNISKETTKSMDDFFKYQFKYLTWKFFILSKVFKLNEVFTINSIFNNLIQKYKILFEEGKRSYITKVYDKDRSINRYMVLKIVEITFESNTNCFTIEFSDSYVSCFTIINVNNPIYNLIERKIIITGLKINIATSRIDKISDDFKMYINIFYNSISICRENRKLGVQKDKKLLIKNIANLREDGGEISMIDVIIIKKYPYYVYDFTTKKRYSSIKYERLLELERENLVKNYEKFSETEDILEKENFNMNMNHNSLKNNATFNFKIICADSLLYYHLLNTISNTNINLKQNKNINKKCIIEITSKTLSTFEHLHQGSRYQIVNLNSNNKFSHYPNSKVLKLKANDQSIFREVKYSFTKKDPSFQNLMSDISLKIGYKCEELDISEYLMENNFNSLKLSNVNDFSFTGIYLNKNIKISNSTSQKNNENLEESQQNIIQETGKNHLFFVNKYNNLVIIKIHSDDFFDLSKMNSYGIYNFKNTNYQIVYYYDSEKKNLSSFKNQMYDKNFNNNNVIIYLETINYTTMNSIISELGKELKKKVSSFSNKSEIYEEILLEEIIKILN